MALAASLPSAHVSYKARDKANRQTWKCKAYVMTLGSARDAPHPTRIPGMRKSARDRCMHKESACVWVSRKHNTMSGSNNTSPHDTHSRTKPCKTRPSGAMYKHTHQDIQETPIAVTLQVQNNRSIHIRKTPNDVGGA